MDTPSAILKKLLPGAWPKMIFGASIVLSGVLYKFYPDLPAKWLPTSEVERFLWRLIVTGISLLLGAAALIISLIFRINNDQKKHKEEANKPPLFFEVNKNFIASPDEVTKKQTNQIEESPSDVATAPAKEKPIFSNNLLWFFPDPNPFCPHCFESDSKQIHMKLKTYLTHPARYYCTRCTFSTLHAEHPDLQSQADEWSPYIPATSADGFVYFKNTVTPGVFACAVCKGKEHRPMILQPIRNAHTPGSYKCSNCHNWGVIP